MILDGGLGLELDRRGFSYTNSLWSAQALIERPAMLTAVHRDFLAAGAVVLETATYQLTHGKLRDLGYADAAIDELFALAVRVARDAIAAHHASGNAPGARDAVYLVAGSMGPYGAVLGDGGEYSGVCGLSDGELFAFHAERLAALVRAAPDLYFFETIPTAREALVVAQVARAAGALPVWIALSSPDGTHAYDGTPLSRIGTQLEAFIGVEAIGVNCIAPAAVARAIRALTGATRKPIVVCPNFGQHWAGATHGLAGGDGAAEFLRDVPAWLALGATHIGGCCGVGPETIAALARIVRTSREEQPTAEVNAATGGSAA